MSYYSVIGSLYNKTILKYANDDRIPDDKGMSPTMLAELARFALSRANIKRFVEWLRTSPSVLAGVDDWIEYLNNEAPHNSPCAIIVITLMPFIGLFLLLVAIKSYMSISRPSI